MSQQGQSNRWDVMSIREYTNSQNEQKSSWTKIGVAFTNKNGSINVQLDAFPIDGKLQLQVPLTPAEKERLFGQRGGGQQQNQGQGGRGQPRGQTSDQYTSNQRAAGGNPRNAGAQQRNNAQQRFGPRNQSQPQRGGFQPTEPYTEPEPDGDAGYVDNGPGESGWEVNGQWITDARALPKDHPDFIPF